MRLKISFEDIKKLFNYMDKSGNGQLGYEEFTLLLEERWRGIDPVDQIKANMVNMKNNPMETNQKDRMNIFADM